MADQPALTPFGRSLLLEDGDFVLEKNKDGLAEFKLVDGLDNLRQGLIVMINTGLGTDVFNVNYGLDTVAIFTTAQSTRGVKDLIRLNLVRSINRDDRITQINDVVFDDDPRYYELSPSENSQELLAKRESSREWRALVVLQTVKAGEVALKLEGTGLST